MQWPRAAFEMQQNTAQCTWRYLLHVTVGNELSSFQEPYIETPLKLPLLLVCYLTTIKH